MSKDIEIRLSPNPVQLRPGESVDLSVTVINNSSAVDRFELNVAEIDPGWFKFDWPEMLLYPEAPGNEGTVYLKVTVPEDAPAGSYSPIIQVSNSQQEIVGTLPFVLSVQQVDVVPLNLALVPEAQETAGQVARFQVHFKNNLSRPNSLRLNARPITVGSEVRLLPPLVELPAYSEGMSFVDVYLPKRNWIGSDRRYDFTVAVENLGAELNGFLVQTCALPWLRRLLATPLLLLAAILMPLLLVGLIILLFGPWNNNPTNSAPVATTQGAVSCVLPNTTIRPSLLMGQNTTSILITRADGTRSLLGSDQLDHLPGLFQSLMSVSPDGNSLAYVKAGNEGLDGAEIVVLNGINSAVPAKTSVATIASGSSLWTTRPVWSRDSDKLSYVVRNGPKLELWTVNLRGNDTRPKLVGTPNQLQPDLFYGEAGKGKGPLCWSKDDTRLLIETNPNTLTEVSLLPTDNKVTPTVKVGAAPEKLFAFSSQAQTGVVKEPALAPLGTGDCFTTPYSQNDPVWRDAAVNSADKRPLAQIGCPFTAAAMMLNYYKSEVRTPADLNDCLNKQDAPFDWTAAANCSNGRMQGGQSVPFNWNDLNASLKRGQPGIVGMLGGQTGTHFVVVVGGSNGIAATYRVNDPWDGSNYKSLADFIASGYQLTTMINFAGTDAPACKKDLTEQTERFPLNLTLLSPLDGKAYNTPINFDYQIDTNADLKATLFNLSDPQNAGIGQATPLKKGDPIDKPGLYKLVIDADLNGPTPSRLTAYFAIDQIPPAITVGFPDTRLETNPGARVARGSANLELKAVDDLTGVASLEYQVDNGDWKSYLTETGSKPIAFKDIKSYTVNYRATDGAGNTTTSQILFSIVSDTAAQTGANGQGQAGAGQDQGQGQGQGQAGAGQGQGTDQNADATKNAAPAVLAGPTQITFAPSDNQQTIQLSNTGQGPANWSIQPLVGPAATYLRFNSSSGTIPPGGTATLTVALSTFNFTPAPVTAPFNIIYNNNTSALAITALVTQQPPPIVQFVSPQAGQQLGGKSVDVRMVVTASGAAAPNHATLTAKYADQVGGPPIDHPLSIVTPPAWATTWDISTLLPQTAMEINGQICWTADESACQRINPGVVGLSLTKPLVNVTLTPDSDKLAGTVTINSQVTSGTIDHITYRYTYKKDPNDSGTVVTLADKATMTKNTVSWDTSVIPPQTGIKLEALVCWGPTDDATSCTGPANQLPTLTVESPVITVNNLSDADKASLPLTVQLQGQVTKLNRAGAVVWVDVSYTPAGATTPTATRLKANLDAPNKGTANWNITIPTDTWPTQATPATFTPEICWDGDPTGPYCVKVVNPQSGTIPPFSAAFTSPADGTTLTGPVSVTVAPVPANRIATIKFFITYLPIGAATPRTDVLLKSTATGANPTINFDSVELGLGPNQTISLKAQACNSANFCGPISTTPLNLVIGDSTLALAPGITPASSTTCPNTCLANSVQIQGQLTGRGVGSIVFSAVFLPNPSSATSTPITRPISTVAPAAGTNSVPAGTITTGAWDTTAIPPQANINLVYHFCWGGNGAELEPQQKCLPDIDSKLGNLSTQQPVVSQFFLTSQEYNFINPTTGDLKLVPIPVNLTTITPTISIPLTVTVTGANVRGVQWRLELYDTSNNPLPTYDNTQAIKLGSEVAPTTPGGNTFFRTVSLNLNSVTLPAGVKLTQINIALVAHPVWFLTGFPAVEYSNDTPQVKNIKRLRTRLVTLDVRLKDNNANGYVSFAPTLNANAGLLINPTTSLRITPDPTNDSADTVNIVKRIIFEVATPNSPSTPLKKSDGTDRAATGTNNWTDDWVHTGDSTSDTPLLEPQRGVVIGWRLCSTVDNTGCLPVLPSTSGVFSQMTAGTSLVLGGIRFFGPDSADGFNLFNEVNSVNKTLSSDFKASVLLTAADPNANSQSNAFNGIVRFWAYSKKNLSNRVLLLTKRVAPTTGNTGTTTAGAPANTVFWTFPVSWPDNFSSAWNLLTPALTPPPLQVSTLANDADDNLITISAQYCFGVDVNFAENPGNYNDDRCSDWQGVAVNHPSWKADVTGKQGAIITWGPYRPGPDLASQNSNRYPGNSYCKNTTLDPFCDWLQELVPSGTTPTPSTNRTLVARVVRIGGPTKAVTYNGSNPVAISLVDPATNRTYAPPPNNAVNKITGGINWDYFTYLWNPSPVCLLPQTTATQPNLQLIATVSFLFGGGGGSDVNTGRTLTNGYIGGLNYPGNPSNC